jgi:hypothetical protein
VTADDGSAKVPPPPSTKREASVAEPFDSDFSYSFYLRLLAAHQHDIRPLRDFDPVSTGRLYLRHDVDLCVDSALALAEVEAENGYSSTFMFIPTSPLYSLRAPEIRRLQSLGHEVAIHFDCKTSGVDPEDEESLLAEIDVQCARISDITGEPVRSVSFHRPLPMFLRGPDYIGGRVNAYSATLMASYRSDSAGRWREGNPLEDIPSTPIAQLLTHPIWWGQDHEAPDLRLETNYRRWTDGMNREESEQFSDLLEETVPGVIRRNSPRRMMA